MPKARPPMDSFPERDPEEVVIPPDALKQIANTIQGDRRITRRPSRRTLAVAGGLLAAGATVLSGPLLFGGEGKEKPAATAAPTSPRPSASASELYCASSEGSDKDMQEFKPTKDNTFVVRILAGCVTDKTVLRQGPDTSQPIAQGAGKPLVDGTSFEIQCRKEGGVMINNEGVESTTWVAGTPLGADGHTPLHIAGYLNLAQLGRASGLPPTILEKIPECQDPAATEAPTPGAPTATPPEVRD